MHSPEAMPGALAQVRIRLEIPASTVKCLHAAHEQVKGKREAEAEKQEKGKQFLFTQSVIAGKSR